MWREGSRGVWVRDSRVGRRDIEPTTYKCGSHLRVSLGICVLVVHFGDDLPSGHTWGDPGPLTRPSESLNSRQDARSTIIGVNRLLFRLRVRVSSRDSTGSSFTTSGWRFDPGPAPSLVKWRGGCPSCGTPLGRPSSDTRPGRRSPDMKRVVPPPESVRR